MVLLQGIISFQKVVFIKLLVLSNLSIPVLFIPIKLCTTINYAVPIVDNEGKAKEMLQFPKKKCAHLFKFATFGSRLK